jgi:uncharacterized protein (DUF169 family)
MDVSEVAMQSGVGSTEPGENEPGEKSACARLEELLATRTPLVAIAFVDEVPAGIARVKTPRPAGCGYWSAAAEGQSFYTTPSDHFGCPVGAHTHHVELSDDVARELGGMIEVMVNLGYLRAADVAAIPRRSQPLRYAIYAPATQATFTPDLVLARGDVRQLMLLAEAAEAAGAQSLGPTLGRPTCAVLPQALGSGRTASSFGCVGNRVYTGASDAEGYFAIPGAVLDKVVASLEVMVEANRQLEAFHRQRAAAS